MPPDLAATLRRLRGEGHVVHVVKTSPAEWDVDLGPIPHTNLDPVMRALEADPDAAFASSGAAR